MGMATSAIRAGQAYVELFTKDEKFKRGLKSASAKLKAFAASAQRIGRQMLMASVVAATPLALATRTFAGFSDQMLTVKAVTGAVGEEFEKLNATAKELGRTTSFTAIQVAQGMTELGRAGFKTNEILAAIPHVLNLARGTATELGEAAMFAAASIRAFNMEAGDMERVADVLTATANNSAQTLTELGESLKYSAPIAADYGESIESISKALGVMANMGIKGSMAGTQLRRIMLQLTDATVQDTLMREYGVNVMKESGMEMKAFGDTMIEIGNAMQSMGQGQRLGVMNLLFGMRGVSGALKLSGAISQVEALDAAISAAGGTSKRTAAIMDSGLGGSFRLLRSALEGIKIAVGEGLEPLLTRMSERLLEIAPAIRAWIERNQQLIVSTAKWIVRIGAAGVALFAIGKVLGMVSVAMGVAAKAVAALQVALAFLVVNPIALAVAAGTAAIIALGLAIRATIKTVGELSDATTKLRKANDERRAADLASITHLRELAAKGKLNNEEMEEAAKVITLLESRYGALGLILDETTGRLNGTAAAFGFMTDAMRAERVGELKAELKDVNAHIQTLVDAHASMAKGGGLWTAFVPGLLKPGAKGAMKDLRGRMAEYAKQGAALRRDIEQLESGKSDNLAGLGGAGVAGAARIDEQNAVDRARLEESLESRLHDLRIQAIEDEEQRALAANKHEYDEKLANAQRLNMDLTTLTETREAEVAAITAKYAQKASEERKRQAKIEAEAKENLQDEITRLQIQTTTEGLDEQLALIEFEREKALRDAGWEDRGDINRKFDLQATLAGQGVGDMGPTRSVRGTFNAMAMQSLQAGSGGPAEETAKNTATLVEETKGQRRDWRNGFKVRLA